MGGRWTRRHTVEHCRVIDAGWMMRVGLIEDRARRSGGIRWGASVSGETDSTVGCLADGREDVLRLCYRSIPFDVRIIEWVDLDRTPLPWGGERFWFRCPRPTADGRCNRRCGKLYLPPSSPSFGCRGCHDLTYQSCRDSHKWDAMYRALARRTGYSFEEVRRVLSEF